MQHTERSEFTPPPPQTDIVAINPIEQGIDQFPVSNISRLELIEISDRHAVFRIRDSGTTKLEIFQADPLNGKIEPRIIVNGQLISNEDLAFRVSAQNKSDYGYQYRPQAVQILIGLAVAWFLWDCGSALYEYYVKQKTTIEVAIGQCLVAGAIAVVSAVGGSVTAQAVKTALAKVVTKEVLKNLTKAGVFQIVSFVADKIYHLILNAIKDLLASYTPPATPTLLISWPNPIKIGKAGILIAAYSDWDRDVRDIRFELKCGLVCWRLMGIFEVRTKPNSDVGSQRFRYSCVRPAGGRELRVTIRDFGNRSRSEYGTIQCVR